VKLSKRLCFIWVTLIPDWSLERMRRANEIYTM
jgi:hypothetical protein